jgi:hypothetical protein
MIKVYQSITKNLTDEYHSITKASRMGRKKKELELNR